jgi:hypothetical protein
MAVEVATNPVFQARRPNSSSSVRQSPTLFWDVTPDGQRFLFPVLANDRSSASFTMVLNWQAALKK